MKRKEKRRKQRQNGQLPRGGARMFAWGGGGGGGGQMSRYYGANLNFALALEKSLGDFKKKKNKNKK